VNRTNVQKPIVPKCFEVNLFTPAIGVFGPSLAAPVSQARAMKTASPAPCRTFGLEARNDAGTPINTRR
jgi:hypothetical protein